MIDPRAITNFYRTEAQLEELIMFCVSVCGKKAMQQAAKLDRVLSQRSADESPFEFWRRLRKPKRRRLLEVAKIGQYTRITSAFESLIDLEESLTTISLERLVSVPGVAYKTGTFFLLHSRPDYELPCLDTHNLALLRDLEIESVPVSSPANRNAYYTWANVYLDAKSKISPYTSLADFDLIVWRVYAGHEVGKLGTAEYRLNQLQDSLHKEQADDAIRSKSNAAARRKRLRSLKGVASYRAGNA